MCFFYLFQKLKQASMLQGCDIQKDAVVLKSGERIGASEVGLLATVCYDGEGTYFGLI